MLLKERKETFVSLLIKCVTCLPTLNNCDRYTIRLPKRESSKLTKYLNKHKTLLFVCQIYLYENQERILALRYNVNKGIRAKAEVQIIEAMKAKFLNIMHCNTLTM